MFEFPEDSRDMLSLTEKLGFFPAQEHSNFLANNGSHTYINSYGGGSGAGFQIHCGDTMLISAGGGGGGALSFEYQGDGHIFEAGGGGGIQIYPFEK
eukprot:UN05741